MSEAWFGCWECECSNVARSPDEITDRCPTHDVPLIPSNSGQTRLQLTHSGVSGYGIRDALGERVVS